MWLSFHNKLFTLMSVALFCLAAGRVQADDMVFVDFQQGNYAAKAQDGATAESFTTPEGVKALKVMIPAKKNYPGVGISAKNGVWDMSSFAYVSLQIRNKGEKKIGLMVRVDNSGDWRKNPWNTERFSIDAGKMKEVKIWFGYSWGKKGYKLDASKITQILIFMQKPKSDATIVVEKIYAGGKAGELPSKIKAAIKLRPKGDLLALDTPTGPMMKAQDKGASAVAAKTSAGKPAVKVTFQKDGGKWPAVYITSKTGRAWNLNHFTQVDFTVRNTGSKPIQVFCRVDNNNANGKINCTTGFATLKPGELKTITAPFVTDKVWTGSKKSGFVFNSSDVKGLTIYSDEKAAGGEIMVEGVVGKQLTRKLPEWSGKRPPVEGDWKMTFEDNFDGNKINTKIWELPVKIGGGKKPENCHQENASIWGMGTVNRPENAIVKNGVLKMKAEKIPEGTKFDNPKLQKRKYYSTVVTTFDSFAQKYGYFEARMKLPKALGLWPAFWLMPDRGKDAGIWWKRQDTAKGGMEFDIMEHLTRFGPNTYHVAMHWDGYGKKHKSIGMSGVYFETDKDGYFTSGLLWEPGKATFFVNDRKVGVWENERVCNVPAFVMFTMPFGGWGNITIEEDKLPDTFDIDYVRVWQRKDLEGK